MSRQIQGLCLTGKHIDAMTYAVPVASGGLYRTSPSQHDQAQFTIAGVTAPGLVSGEPADVKI
jgi:hypothetical protein